MTVDYSNAVEQVHYYYDDIPGLGNVAVSRHAQARAAELGISETKFLDVLLNGTDRPDGMEEVWREKGAIRLVILLRPTPFRGAKLVKTIFRVKPQW